MEEVTYKYSKYNIELETENEDEVTIFNTYTSKYVTLDKEVVDDLKGEEYLPMGDFPDYLVDLGIFVPSTLDEFQRVYDENKRYKQTSNSLEFVIAGTSNCPYNCIYCFEQNYLNKRSDMSIETQKETIEFIKRECEKRESLDNVFFQLFGGEPCLSVDVFEKIIGDLKSYFNEKGIKFASRIVTNGYLLTSELTDRLKETCNLISCQITLDGSKDAYERLKRPPKCAFNKVIENIKAIQDKIQIDIRLNVYDNVEDLKELISYLANLNININIYYSDVRNFDNSPNEYKQIYEKYLESDATLDAFIRSNNYTNLFKIHYCHKGLRKCVGCGANTNNYFVIDTEGNLYKCLDNIFNPSYVVGNVFEGLTNESAEDIYLNRYYKEECKESCPMFPICSGYCTAETVSLPTANVCDVRRKLLKHQIQRYMGFC